MPTVILEGPQLSLLRKRRLMVSITRAVAQAYDWPEDQIIILHANPDQNIARGGRLLSDRREREVR